jgi:hypothetical protein
LFVYLVHERVLSDHDEPCYEEVEQERRINADEFLFLRNSEGQKPR